MKEIYISKSATFKDRIIKASIWIFAGHFLSQGLRLASNLIMTRLLVPEMFGLMAIVYVLLTGLAMLTDLGLRENIIQSKRADEDVFLNTVWTFQIVRGFFVWGVAILVAIAVYIAQKYALLPAHTVYAEPNLPFIIPATTFIMVLNGFEPTWTALASRNLQQDKLVKIDLFTQVVSIVVMILLALAFRSIWSLVIGALVGNLIRLLLVNYLIKAKRNRFALDKTVLHELFHFGKWVFLSSVVGFLFNNGDKLLLGALVTTKELGVYSVAAYMVGAVSAVVSSLMGNVAFPALSETIREKPYEIKRVYYRFRIPFDAGLLFVSGFLLIAGQGIINFMYDSRYSDAGWMMHILALSLISIRFNLADQFYMAIGKPKVMASLTMLRTTFMFIGVPIAFHFFEIRGAIWAIVVSYFSSFPLALYYKNTHDLLDIKKEFITFPMIFLGMACGFIFNKIMMLIL